MRTLYSLCGGVVLALLTASSAAAMDATTQQNDLGAGPIEARVTACLVANRTHSGPPCPEPAVSASPDAVERIANRLQRAWFFIDMEDLEKARVEAELALGVDPKDVTARLLSARLALTAGDIARAEADLALAKQRAPHNPDILATHAMLLESKPADIDALREFTEVLNAHPGHRFALEQRAELLMKLNMVSAALEDFNAMVAIDPSGANSLERRSSAFLALGKPQSAVADLSAALKLYPERFDLIIARADAYAQADLGELALRDYDTVLASVPGGQPLYAMLDAERAKLLTKRAYVNLGMRRFDDAAGDMVAALRLGGVPAILRTQVLLRRNGFSDVPIDGQDSPVLRRAVSACFGLDACFHGIMKSI